MSSTLQIGIGFSNPSHNLETRVGHERGRHMTAFVKREVVDGITVRLSNRLNTAAPALEKQETKSKLRHQGPENDTGSFDPVLVYRILRSPSTYSLPYEERQLSSGRVSRVPFAGRMPCDTTTMNTTRRSTAEESQ